MPCFLKSFPRQQRDWRKVLAGWLRWGSSKQRWNPAAQQMLGLGEIRECMRNYEPCIYWEVSSQSVGFSHILFCWLFDEQIMIGIFNLHGSLFYFLAMVFALIKHSGWKITAYVQWRTAKSLHTKERKTERKSLTCLYNCRFATYGNLPLVLLQILSRISHWSRNALRYKNSKVHWIPGILQGHWL